MIKIVSQKIPYLVDDQNYYPKTQQFYSLDEINTRP
jgi:hypothetical protein